MERIGEREVVCLFCFFSSLFRILPLSTPVFACQQAITVNLSFSFNRQKLATLHNKINFILFYLVYWFSFLAKHHCYVVDNIFCFYLFIFSHNHPDGNIVRTAGSPSLHLSHDNSHRSHVPLLWSHYPARAMPSSTLPPRRNRDAWRERTDVTIRPLTLDGPKWRRETEGDNLFIRRLDKVALITGARC